MGHGSFYYILLCLSLNNFTCQWKILVQNVKYICTKKKVFFFTHLGASVPLDLYEGLHDQILTSPDCSEPNPSTKTTTEVIPEMSNSCQSSVQNRNIPQDFVTATEFKEALHAGMKSLEKKLNNNENDQDFL